jgi:prephenate dehydratase
MTDINQLVPVGIQGYEGSFHHQAVQYYFRDKATVVPFASFASQAASLKQKQVQYALMAIENSIAGSILPNYNLIRKNKFCITGEIYLHIHHHLLANPGVSLEQIREVQSHPMALLQCTEFLEQHHFKTLETEDTALSAKHIAQYRSKHIAAIAGSLAAKQYGLVKLAASIQTHKENYTRFLILQNKQAPVWQEHHNKCSLYFETNHSQGSLAKVLTAVAKQKINMSKIQSLPISGKKFNYGFYMDWELQSQTQYQKGLEAIQPLTTTLHALGSYAQGNTYNT